MSNYEVFKQNALQRFLEYDHDALIQRLGLQSDEDYIYVDFGKQHFRIGRKMPEAAKNLNAADAGNDNRENQLNWVEASSNEALTLCDLLCHTDKPIRLSNDYRTIQRLNRVQGGNAQVILGNGFWDESLIFFDENEELLKKACEALGGIPAGKGDVAYEIPLFEPIRLRFSFYGSDDEFDAEMTFMFAAEICDFLHYETLYYVVNIFVDNLLDYMKRASES